VTNKAYHAEREKARGRDEVRFLRRLMIAAAWAFGLAAFGTIGAIERFQIGVGSGLARFAVLTMAAIAAGFCAGIMGGDGED